MVHINWLKSREQKWWWKISEKLQQKVEKFTKTKNMFNAWNYKTKII